MKPLGWTLSLAGLISLCAGCQYPSDPGGTLPVRPLGFGRNTTAYAGVPGRQPIRVQAPTSGGEPEWSNVPAIREWRYIVIHHSASEKGNAAIFNVEHHQRGWPNGLGYHFVIDNGNPSADGRIEVGERWEKQLQGAHTGNTPGNEYNEHGIGICLVGNFNEHMPTQAQLSSLYRLVTFLCAKYNIPPSRIIGHKDAPGANTECPGNLLQAHVHNQLRRSLGR